MPISAECAEIEAVILRMVCGEYEPRLSPRIILRSDRAPKIAPVAPEEINPLLPQRCSFFPCAYTLDQLSLTGYIVSYGRQWMEVRQTETFRSWLRHLRDDQAKARIIARIRRLEQGNPGDVAPVGAGVSEMRIHYGPGYRVYFVQRGADIVVLLCGGDKKTQAADIEAAKEMAKAL